MKGGVLNSLFALCLIALIAGMSWRDMHPRSAPADTSLLDMLTYYAGPEATSALMPDDRLPVTIDVGDFSYASDGRTIWTPHGMAPTTFPQRQINLQFNFKSLPQDPAQTIEKINAVAGEWVHKGDIVNTYIVNYSPEKADLKDYAKLLHAAYDKFSKITPVNSDRIIIVAGINIQWGEGALKDLQELAPKFLVHLPQTHISPELLSQLAALDCNLILQYPAGTQVADIDMAAFKKLNSLSGITLPLDPHRPLLKKEDKVGLFPKF